MKDKHYLVFLLLALTFILLSLNFVNSQGGGTISMSTIEVTEEGENFGGTEGRLRFEFNNKWYAIQMQLTRIDHSEFLVMTLDRDKLDDVTAITIDENFNLKPGDTKEIDLDKDGTNDIFMELYNIENKDLGGKLGSRRLPNFYIKKIGVVQTVTENSEVETLPEISEVKTLPENNINAITENKIVEENVINSLEVNDNEKPLPKTFVQVVVEWFRNLFNL